MPRGNAQDESGTQVTGPPVGRPHGVLYVHTTSEIGGADVALLRLVRGLDQSRFAATVVLPAEGPLTEALRASGCDVVVLPGLMNLSRHKGLWNLVRYGANFPRAVAALAHLIRGRGIDLVHSNTLHTLQGFVAARLTRTPHVWHVREIVLQSRLARSVEGFLAPRFSAAVVTVSDAARAMFLDRRGRLPRNVATLYDGVDTRCFVPGYDGSGVRRELGLDPEALLVGFVGRLDHWKGVDVFLRASAICTKCSPEARFVVIGGAVEGREEVARQLEQLAQRLGIDDVVRFAGWRYGPDAMPAVFAALDIVVLPSTWPEPFGLVLVEAMASAKPVIASNHGGPVEVCVPGATGLLVRPGDPEALASTMLELLHDPDRRARMGQQGRARVEEHFEQRRCVERFEALYEAVVAGSRKGKGLGAN
jgi:glycosyltransferase involved in cell wall biosynthesis